MKLNINSVLRADDLEMPRWNAVAIKIYTRQMAVVVVLMEMLNEYFLGNRVYT